MRRKETLYRNLAAKTLNVKQKTLDTVEAADALVVGAAAVVPFCKKLKMDKTKIISQEE